MTKHIHIYLPARRTSDAGAFKEGDHPRKPDGKFGSGGGGSAGKAGPTGKAPAAKPAAKAMSFREVLSDPEHKREVESIEEMTSALRDKGGNDPFLPAMIKSAKERLKKATGYEYK